MERELKYLLLSCACSRLVLSGKCTPKKCFPKLIKLVLNNKIPKWEIIKCDDGIYRKFEV